METKKPKEKAEELVKQYLELLKKTDTCLAENCKNTLVCQHSWYACEGWLSYAKKSALIAVDEIINAIVIIDLTSAENQFIYWEEVKQEIEKL
jgi:hypothetical protein